MYKTKINKEAVVLLTTAILIFSSVVAVANTQQIQDTAISLDFGIETKNAPVLPSVPKIANVFEQTFYAIEYINDNAESFDPADPGTTTVIGTNSMPAYAGTWFDGQWYIQDNTLMEIYTVNITDASTTYVCTATQAFNGIASDGTTMYGATSTQLYTVDLGTGACSLVGSFGTGGLMIDLGIDMDTGICYGHDIGTDSIYTIDLGSGVASIIGSTGWNANYAQGMEFDQDNDILYLTLMDGAALYARLCTVDLSSGLATSIGDIGVGYYVEYGAFAIPYTAVEPKIPNLDCDGQLAWEDVVPGDTVEGTFEVSNIGDPESLLNWEISQTPEWGTNWTFDPDGGTGLTPEDGAVTVSVSVEAPDDPETEFEGEIVIINSADPADNCTISVSLVTPVSQPTVFMQFIDWLFARFPILALIFG